MIKRIILGFAAFTFATIAHAAGTIPGFSLTPQFDNFGKVMPGCKLFVIQAGTTATPQNAYQDSALTIPLPNPLTCDASGRLPQFFLADGLIKIRLTNAAGTQQLASDNLLVIGPSTGGGGGGGGTVDPTTIFTTGDIKTAYGTGTITGWVRANGRSIGSAISGASERANADTQALFVWLWNNDSTLIVNNGGRGASAAADWAANKVINLPDYRGRTEAGVDDMGGGDAARLGGGSLAGCRFSLGCAGGESTHTLLASEIPQITSANGSQALSLSPPAGQSFAAISSGFTISSIQVGAAGAGTNWAPITGGNVWGAQNVVSGSNSISVTSNNTGGSTHNNMQPTILVTKYIKL
jgi:hypothetical protein